MKKRSLGKLMKGLICIGFSFGIIIAGYSHLRAAVYLNDNLESGLNNWIAGTGWSLTEEDSASATHSCTDSPGGHYQNNTNSSLTLASSIDLSSIERPQLKFLHKYELEYGFDFGYLEISIDRGTNWEALAIYTGLSGNSPPNYAWVTEDIDLADYSNQSNVLIRFRLETDKSIVTDGWYIDDIVIGDTPYEVILYEPVKNASNSLKLSWSKSLDSDFSYYRIYRSTTTGVNLKDTLVAEIPDREINTFIDTVLDPQTTYYYRVYVFNTFDLFSKSKEKEGTTSDHFCYLTDFEDELIDWQLDEPWSVSDRDSHSGNYCLADSAYQNYTNNLDKSAIFTVDLVNCNRSLLSFWHKHNFQSYKDFGYVEVKREEGAWKRLFFATGRTGEWIKAEIDLSEYYGYIVYVRFRVITDGSTTLDGWYIDDVSITDT